MPRTPPLVPILALTAALLPIPSLRAASAPLAWPPVTAVTRPWTRWWWMGDAVDFPNLDRELTRYHAAGLGGVEVTPIYGVKGWEDREIPYLTPKWMEMLNHAISTGARLGMKTDMTTGTGWCFGGPTVSALDANCVIVSGTQVVQPGASLTGTFNPATTQALVAFSPDGKSLDLTSRIAPDGTVNWTADTNDWHVLSISQKPSRVVVKRAAPGGAGPMLNPFYPGAITRYMQWFQAPFAAARPRLNSLFQDSYEYNSQWSPDFFAQFEKLRGYKLQTELPALTGTALDDHTSRVKSDYRETISDMMSTESMPIWVKWAHDHGYTARYQAHGDPGNLLDLYAIADIPETEMFYQQQNILVSKFASSAAHVTGKNLASSESCTWLDEHFTETLADIKNEIDKFFLAGINHIIYQGTAYSPDEAPWPGWCFYASIEMNPRNSIWRDVLALNTYITRCQSVLQSGKPENDILLYWPIYDRWSDPRGLVQQFAIGGVWFLNQPIGATAQHLWNRGYSFDYISDRQLAAIRPGGSLPGGYRAIVVPPSTLMPVGTLKQLQDLAAAGTPIIFDTKLPSDVPGLADLDNRRQQFKTLIGLMNQNGHVFVGDIEAGLVAANINRETMTDTPGLDFLRRKTAGGTYYFIANKGAKPVDGPIALAAGDPSKAVGLMDPMTGRVGVAPTSSGSDGNIHFHLQLDPGQSIIVRTFDNPTGHLFPLWRYHIANAPNVLNGTWSVKFIDGGPTLPAPFQTDKLDSWTTIGGADAQAFAGTALYSLTFDAPPDENGPWSIDLGKVCQSARVRLNGKSLGTVFMPPFRVEAPSLKPTGNLLEVEVTNASANRVRDLDIRHVDWKNFDPPGLLNVHYKPFDASAWPLTDSGLFGPITITSQSIASQSPQP